MPDPPILILDSRELWKPVAVDDSLARFDYHCRRRMVARRVPAERINLPPEMSPADFADLPPVGYHRVAQGGGIRMGRQRWTWWPYNPKTYAGIGAHEGDWEMVQTGRVGSTPVLMTCAQHDGGERREWWRVEKGRRRPHRLHRPRQPRRLLSPAP